MTYTEFKAKTIGEFEKFTDNAKNEIDAIIMHCTGYKKNELLMRRSDEIPPDIIEKLDEAVKRRTKREPLQYILGEWEFFGLRMFCGKGCLIPRPETELLADIAIKNLPRGGRFLDLCTGSGCISVAILNNRPDVTAVAVDISDEALFYAQKNAEYHGIGKDRLRIVKGDIYTYRPDFFPDLIVSNPPYIKTDDIQTLNEEVKHEPHLALDGGHDGLDFYKLIAKSFCNRYLTDGGICAVEVGYDIGEEVTAIFRSQKFDVNLIRDTFEVDRVCLARKIK